MKIDFSGVSDETLQAKLNEYYGNYMYEKCADRGYNAKASQYWSELETQASNELARRGFTWERDDMFRYCNFIKRPVNENKVIGHTMNQIVTALTGGGNA